MYAHTSAGNSVNNDADNSAHRSGGGDGNSNSKSSSSAGSGGGGFTSRLTSLLTSTVGSLIGGGTGCGADTSESSSGGGGSKRKRRSSEAAAAAPAAADEDDAEQQSSPPSTPERRQTRNARQREEQDRRRSTRSSQTPTSSGRKLEANLPSASASSSKKKRKLGDPNTGNDGTDVLPPAVHPLDQRYSTRLFAEQNARTDIDYDLVPVDLGGAFIHGTGYETDVKTGRTSRLDWGSGSGGGSGGGGKKGNNSKANINPLYALVRSMGVPTVPLDGCTLMDADGNNVDDVLASSLVGGKDNGSDKEADDPSLDAFVQHKFNGILDDCHEVISRLKKLERAQRRGEEKEDNATNPRKRRRLAKNGGSGKKKSSLSSRSKSASKVPSVKLPDGTVATPSTDFATLFNAIASSKSIFLNGSSTLPADLFSWHTNNLEMSCGAPFPALGLKWNEDERYNFGGDHVVLRDGWGKVVENLAEGNGNVASAGEGNGPVNIRYGCEVQGIRIVPPEGYDGDLVDDVDEQGDDLILSDYEALESDDDDDDDSDGSSESEDDDGKSEKKSKPTPTKAKRASAKPKPTPKAAAKKPVATRAVATGSSTPLRTPASARGEDEEDTVKTRSRSKPQIRRSSRSNIGQVDMGSASTRYSPTFESDLKRFSPIKSTPTKKKKTKSNATTPKSSAKKLSAEQFALSPDSSRDPDVHHSTVQVRTKLDDGTVQTYEADHVLMTCPLGVLQVPCNEPGHIVFNPPLPTYKRESINRLGFGHYNKIALAFPYRFWDEMEGDDFFGVAASPEDKLGGSILAVDLGKAHMKSGGGDGPIILMIFGGAYAKKMESMSDEILVGEAMEVVRSAWEGKMKQGDSVPDPVDFVVTRWGKDRYARGSFSYVKPGGDGFVEALKIARPVFDPYDPVLSSSSSKSSNKGKRSSQKSKRDESENRPMILFAGEHTSSVYPSTIHGAYLSGIREATRLDLTLEPAMNGNYDFDNKTVYDRTFDMHWRSRYAGSVAAFAKKKSKRSKMSSKSADAASSRTMMEDATILRQCDVHGTSVDAISRVSDLSFPIPAQQANGKKMTGKGIARRYNELTAEGCNATRDVADEQSWLVDEDQVFVVTSEEGDRLEEYFDWDAAAEIEQEHEREDED